MRPHTFAHDFPFCEVFEWMERSRIGEFMRGSQLIFPIFEIIHLLGLALFVGTLVLTDMGLLGLNSVTVSANAQTARNCHIQEGDAGVLMNADTKAPFGYSDACIELNPHVGGNPATAEQARKAVVEFLQALFMLG